MERIRGGDQRAFDQLVVAYYERLCDFAFGFVRVREAAEDVVQDVFIRLWEQRTNLRLDEPTAYLFRAVRNGAISVLRHEQVRARSDVLESIEPHVVESAAERYERDELERAVQHAVDTLPDRCRLIFTMSRNHGLARGEIAAALGLSVRTVDAQIARAFKLIRQRVAPLLL
jgi:RNA polymerase sigma-70 factor, ECF subfamily